MGNKRLALLIFAVVTSTILILGIGMPSVWTDTAVVIQAKGNTFSAARTLLGVAVDVWRDDISKPRYAPLTYMQIVTQVRVFGDNTLPSTILIAVMWGILAVAIYLLAVEVTGKKLIGLGAVLLYSFSVPGLQTAWTLLNTNPLVESLIVFGLYSYVRYQKTKRLRWFCLLIICGVIAPLVRELAIILPIVTLLDMIIEKKWDTKLLVSLPLLLLHNIFPSTLPNLFFGKFVAISVFSRGVPKIYGLGTSWITELGLTMPTHLILFISPILIILASLSLLLFFGKRLGGIKKVLVISILLLGCLSMFTEAAIFGMPLWATLLIGVIAFASFSYNKLLVIWLLVAWVPFFWLYNAVDAGLIAPAIPFTIMIAMWIYKLLARIKMLKLNFAFALVEGLLIVGLLGQVCNLIAVRQSFIESAAITREMSAWLVANIPENSIVISDLIHGVELKYFANDWFEHYYAFEMPGFPPNVSDPASYDKLVKENYPTRAIYILAGLSLPDGENHWLLHQDGKVLELQKEFVMSEKYPIADPLKLLLPESYRPYGGPPDLVNEIQIRNEGLFSQEAYAGYGLYKLVQYTGTK